MQGTEGGTLLQPVSSAATGTCPVPSSCCSASQHHFRRNWSLPLHASVLPTSNWALEVLAARASSQPASCCSQLTLMPTPVKPRLSYTKSVSCQVAARPDGHTTMLPAGFSPSPSSSCLVSHPAALSLPALWISPFTHTYDLIFTPTI